jgi:hypothetical protein
MIVDHGGYWREGGSSEVFVPPLVMAPPGVVFGAIGGIAAGTAGKRLGSAQAAERGRVARPQSGCARALSSALSRISV